MLFNLIVAIYIYIYLNTFIRDTVHFNCYSYEILEVKHDYKEDDEHDIFILLLYGMNKHVALLQYK